MILSSKTLVHLARLLEEVAQGEPGNDWMVTDYPDDYGEPGYSAFDYVEGKEKPILIGNWHWKRDDERYKRIIEALERQAELLWDDEWVSVYCYKDGVTKYLAYRTEADSYHWQSSIFFSEEAWEWEAWEYADLDYLIARAEQGLGFNKIALPRLIEAGFEKLNSQEFENGWFQGQNDDATELVERYRERYPNHTIIPVMQKASQFYITFDIYGKEQEDED